jgi:hypothetical protein
MLEPAALFSTPAKGSMVGSSILYSFLPASARVFAGIVLGLLLLVFGAAAQGNQSSTSSAQSAKRSEIPRGKKLILKDGTYQVVREYQRNGDRVRYFSAERGDWEEIPAAMIDWDATAKDEAATQRLEAAEVEKLHKQEEAKRMDNVADIDASLQVGEGAFLPQGEGLFVVEGKSVRLLQQTGSANKVDTMRSIEQVLSPVPVVPGKQKVIIQGERATLRLRSTVPEFYLREAPPDPERVSPILKSSRPGESGPELILIRAKVLHNARLLEAIGTFHGQTVSKNRNEIPIQRWEVAPTVYRFTLGQALPPGEYVFAEVLEDGLNYYVWDFGVDANTAADTKK